MILTRRGQSIVEYTIIVGIVTMVIFYMGTTIKRGAQSLIKVTADQVGNQQNSDQDFNDIRQGYTEASVSSAQQTNNRVVTEAGYIPVSGNAVYTANTSYEDNSDSFSNAYTNGGFQQTGQ